jgi:hypothetical protein
MPYACAMLSSVACPTLYHFSTLYRKQHDFLGGEKKFEHKMCVSIFPTNYVWNIFHSKKNWLRYDQKNILVCMKITCYSFDILMKIEFTWQFFWKILIFQELHQVGAESFHADVQTYWWTDMMNLQLLFTILQMCLMMRIWVDIIWYIYIYVCVDRVA